MLNYDFFLLILGFTFLAAVLLPDKLTNLPLSLSIIWLGIGVGLSMLDPGLPKIDPLKNSMLAERFTEMAIILSLLSAGLKLDRPISWYSWGDTWRLLLITMPLCIFLMMLGAIYLTGLPLAAALLLGAVIAPTDPVLAHDVQVGSPGKGKEHDVRFALTSEAGLNDGLAFPFVNLALLLGAANFGSSLLVQWIVIDVIVKIAIGVLVGIGIGYFTAKILLKPSRNLVISDGFLAIALTLLAYGAAQVLYGYGFLAVFIAAYVFRHYDNDHHFHTILHNFSQQIERLIVPLLLVVMGIFIYQGVFSNLSWQEVVLALVFLGIIRPLSGLLGLLGSKTNNYHKLLIAIFGIRGIGTFYYLAYVASHTGIFNQYNQELWRISSLIILISIILHGMSSSIIFRRIANTKE